MKMQADGLVDDRRRKPLGVTATRGPRPSWVSSCSGSWRRALPGEPGWWRRRAPSLPPSDRRSLGDAKVREAVLIDLRRARRRLRPLGRPRHGARPPRRDRRVRAPRRHAGRAAALCRPAGRAACRSSSSPSTSPHVQDRLRRQPWRLPVIVNTVAGMRDVDQRLLRGRRRDGRLAACSDPPRRPAAHGDGGLRGLAPCHDDDPPRRPSRRAVRLDGGIGYYTQLYSRPSIQAPLFALIATLAFMAIAITEGSAGSALRHRWRAAEHCRHRFGGTFTESRRLPRTGASITAKTSTVPADPTEGAAASSALPACVHSPRSANCARLDDRQSTPCSDARAPRTALVTTAGFRRRLRDRPRQPARRLQPLLPPPPPLVPRELTFEVDERMSGARRAVVPLDVHQLDALGDRLVSLGIEAVASASSTPMRTQRTRQRAGTALRRRAAELFVTLSHEILREFREYERTSTDGAQRPSSARGQDLSRSARGLARCARLLPARSRSCAPTAA